MERCPPHLARVGRMKPVTDVDVSLCSPTGGVVVTSRREGLSGNDVIKTHRSLMNQQTWDVYNAGFAAGPDGSEDVAVLPSTRQAWKLPG